MTDNLALLRDLPKIDEALKLAVSRPEMKAAPYPILLEAVREIVEGLRKKILSGAITELPSDTELAELMVDAVKVKSTFNLRPVINATGIVLHTNLGRAPLSESVMEHVKAVATEYSSLEYKSSEGVRGSRDANVEGLLRGLTGCEAAMVVNNNAAAVLLILSALCKNREVIVSRGELVEIGGSFRLPDIMAQGGAILKEVGTTNKTRISDYQLAVTEHTGALLKVHTSNFRVIGFAEETRVAELKRLGSQHKIPVIYDLGSGSLGGTSFDEPTISEGISDGADLLCFSADKLLGGPQSGIILGKAELIAKLRAHPFTRALRPDKLTLAALEATLRLYLEPEKARAEIPALAMLNADIELIRLKAELLCDELNKKAPSNIRIITEQTEGEAGGGSAPGQKIISWSVVFEVLNGSVHALEQGFRMHETPIIGRISHGKLIFDARTIEERHFAEILSAFEAII